MKPISRVSVAYAALVALATLTAGAIAQVPDRVIYGVLPPADGEANNPNRDIGPDYEYQLKPMY